MPVIDGFLPMFFCTPLPQAEVAHVAKVLTAMISAAYGPRSAGKLRRVGCVD